MHAKTSLSLTTQPVGRYPTWRTTAATAVPRAQRVARCATTHGLNKNSFTPPGCDRVQFHAAARARPFMGVYVVCVERYRTSMAPSSNVVVKCFFFLCKRHVFLFFFLVISLCLIFRLKKEGKQTSWVLIGHTGNLELRLQFRARFGDDFQSSSMGSYQAGADMIYLPFMADFLTETLLRPRVYCPKS